MSNLYAKAGVDVEVEKEASKIMYEASKLTHKNRRGRIGKIITPTDDFSGVRMIDVSNLPKGSCMSIDFDGTGRVVDLTGRVHDYAAIAFHLVAMIADDAARRGAEPVLI